MTGVKGYIRDSIPPEWEKALLEHKCILSFIEQFYQAIAKPKNRNKYHYNVTIMQARHDIRIHSLIEIATIYKFKEGISFWNNVNDTVITYKEQWK